MKHLALILCLIGYAICGPSVVRTKEEIEQFKQFLEDSRTDDGIVLDSRMLLVPNASVWENSGKYQGDIVLDDSQIEDLVEDFAKGDTGGSGGRNAYVVANTRWPNNIMVYAFGANEFDAAQQRAIHVAMSWVEHFSCVRFRRRTTERVFVTMRGRAGGCYASVGFSTVHPNRVFNLARNTPGRGCFHHVVIIHELLHNLGFQHMHQTYERDRYVRINWNNIIARYRFAFERFRRNQVNLLGLPYEFTSCMHYSTHAFSSNRQPTITALRSFPGVMGQIDAATYWDWLRLRRHYNCPGAWRMGQMEKLKEEVDRMAPLMKMNLAPPEKRLFEEDDLVNQDVVFDENYEQ